jgi:hypothetical protein
MKARLQYLPNIGEGIGLKIDVFRLFRFGDPRHRLERQAVQCFDAHG